MYLCVNASVYAYILCLSCISAVAYLQISGCCWCWCSAGVGRTGTFITIDVLLKKMEKEGAVNIFNLVRQLRFRRERSVETPVSREEMVSYDIKVCAEGAHDMCLINY